MFVDPKVPQIRNRVLAVLGEVERPEQEDTENLAFARLEGYTAGANLYSELAGGFSNEESYSEIIIALWPPDFNEFRKFCGYYDITPKFFCHNAEDAKALEDLGYEVEVKGGE